MKKIKLLTAFAATMAFSAPAFSIAQIGVNGNYTSDKFSNGTTFSGVGFSGFARFTAGIPLLVTFGFGPYFDYSSLSGGPASSPDVKQLRAGGELAVYLDVVGNVLGLTPYARFGYGYEGNTLKTTIAPVTSDVLYYGTGGHTLFGLTYKVLPLIYLFAEGGIQWSSLTASVPSELKSLVSMPDITTSGWRMSLGAMIWL